MANHGVSWRQDDRGLHTPGRRLYQPAELRIEGDWSGAAPLLVMASSWGPLCVSDLDPSSSQPDRGLLEALTLAGAAVHVGRRHVTVSPGVPRAFTFDATHRPDLFPPLAALAAACPGESRLIGVHRLHDKESDRAAALCTQLARLGCDIRTRDDALLIRGPTPWRPATVDPQGDHRVAMALAVAGVMGARPLTITGADCVDKSYPAFFAHLRQLGVTLSLAGHTARVG